MSRLMTRKEFLKYLGSGTAALACGGLCPGLLEAKEERPKDVTGHVFEGEAPESLWEWSVEGFHYATDGDLVQCLVCPNQCVLAPGDRSVCRSKANMEGKLYSLTYGNPCAVHIDPIEKKPLYHFHPGSSILSIATTGCNFRCLNCQNWEISQRRPEKVRHYELFPSDVVEEAKRKGIPSIAYTYSEPISFYEYMYDTAKEAEGTGMKNVLVSNGYINRGPLLELARYIHGANVNLKSFDDKIYRALNGGRLKPVLETFKTLHEQGVWFEMTTLVVPTYIDDHEMIKQMCGWILNELGPDYPLHFLRFFPRYKLKRLPPTPVTTLEKMRDLALKEGIHYVYVGNVPDHEGNHTYCRNCGQMLVERKGYRIEKNRIKQGSCAFCGTTIPGRWA